MWQKLGKSVSWFLFEKLQLPSEIQVGEFVAIEILREIRLFLY